MGIPFILKVRPIDERNIGDRSDGSNPSKLVMELAKAKSEALISALLANEKPNEESNEEKYDMTLPPELKECIVLTGDQVVTCKDSILEKPDNVTQAKEFVAKYGTVPPSTVGSVVLTHLPSKISVSDVDISTIHFKSSLSEADNASLKEDLK